MNIFFSFVLQQPLCAVNSHVAALFLPQHHIGRTPRIRAELDHIKLDGSLVGISDSDGGMSTRRTSERYARHLTESIQADPEPAAPTFFARKHGVYSFDAHTPSKEARRKSVDIQETGSSALPIAPPSGSDRGRSPRAKAPPHTGLADFVTGSSSLDLLSGSATKAKQLQHLEASSSGGGYADRQLGRKMAPPLADSPSEMRTSGRRHVLSASGAGDIFTGEGGFRRVSKPGTFNIGAMRTAESGALDAEAFRQSLRSSLPEKDAAASSLLRARFARLDGDRDGHLTNAELVSALYGLDVSDESAVSGAAIDSAVVARALHAARLHASHEYSSTSSGGAHDYPKLRLAQPAAGGADDSSTTGKLNLGTDDASFGPQWHRPPRSSRRQQQQQSTSMDNADDGCDIEEFADWVLSGGSGSGGGDGDYLYQRDEVDGGTGTGTDRSSLRSLTTITTGPHASPHSQSSPHSGGGQYESRTASASSVSAAGGGYYLGDWQSPSTVSHSTTQRVHPSPKSIVPPSPRTKQQSPFSAATAAAGKPSSRPSSRQPPSPSSRGFTAAAATLTKDEQHGAAQRSKWSEFRAKWENKYGAAGARELSADAAAAAASSFNSNSSSKCVNGDDVSAGVSPNRGAARSGGAGAIPVAPPAAEGGDVPTPFRVLRLALGPPPPPSPITGHT